MDFIFVLGVDNGYGNTFQQAQRDKVPLVLGETVVLESERRARKDLFCVDKVDVVSPQVTSTFPRIPRKSHMRIVYTHMRIGKQRLERANSLFFGAAVEFELEVLFRTRACRSGERLSRKVLI